eukprot:1700928-Alexandrium_andersonii.AAC.1
MLAPETTRSGPVVGSQSLWWSALGGEALPMERPLRARWKPMGRSECGGRRVARLLVRCRPRLHRRRRGQLARSARQRTDWG